MTNVARKTPYELTQEPPKYAENTADLYDWSLNFDAGEGPFALFLDLIGWSDDELGEPLYNLKTASLGYLELSELGDALNEYTDNPQPVREFVNALMEAESAE